MVILGLLKYLSKYTWLLRSAATESLASALPAQLGSAANFCPSTPGSVSVVSFPPNLLIVRLLYCPSRRRERLRKIRENSPRGLSPREEIPEAQAGGQLGAHFLPPPTKGSGKNFCPSPKQAPLIRSLRTVSLARDQETLQAVRRCLSKPAAFRQV